VPAGRFLMLLMLFSLDRALVVLLVNISTIESVVKSTQFGWHN